MEFLSFCLVPLNEKIADAKPWSVFLPWAQENRNWGNSQRSPLQPNSSYFSSTRPNNKLPFRPWSPIFSRASFAFSTVQNHHYNKPRRAVASLFLASFLFVLLIFTGALQKKQKSSSLPSTKSSDGWLVGGASRGLAQSPQALGEGDPKRKIKNPNPRAEKLNAAS